MPDEPILVRIETNKQHIQTVFKSIINSTPGMELQEKKNGRYTDLAIIEIADGADSNLSLVRGLLNSGEVGEVFLTAEKADPEILRQAMRIGVKEFFNQPLQESEIRSALQAFKQRHKGPIKKEESKRGKIITVVGSKGGVGTTTIAVNLSVNITTIDTVNLVALLDMNKTFGEIPLFLSMKTNFDWSEIVKNIDRMDASFLMNILSKHPSGVHVLSSPSRIDHFLIPTPTVVEQILLLMQKMFDYIIIDGGANLDDVSLKFIESSDRVVLVSCLSLPHLFTTIKFLESLDHLGYPTRERVGIVINRYIKGGEMSLTDAEKSFKHKIFWSVPNDYSTTTSAINQGKTIAMIAPKSEIAASLDSMSRALIYGKDSLQDTKKLGGSFLKRLLS